MYIYMYMCVYTHMHIYIRTKYFLAFSQLYHLLLLIYFYFADSSAPAVLMKILGRENKGIR